MSLRSYRNPVESYLISAGQLLWANQFVNESIALATSRGKAPKNPKSRARQLKTHQVCCMAFCGLKQLGEQFNDLHNTYSIWPPDVDFFWRGQKIRVVSVGADESHNFGATLLGRVWENDFARGKCTAYVLASWFPPYVDLVGWLSREELAGFRERSWYAIQESNSKPIATLGGGA